MKIDWIAVDWGTSNLRIWAMDSEDNVRKEVLTDEGMGRLESHQFEPVLLSHIAPWLNAGHSMPVVACGMVGAKQGWQEAPYARVPTLPARQKIKVQTHDKRLNLHIISGLKQYEPADVMRGEETQLAGLLADFPTFAGAVCLPGTHSKWAQVAGGEVQKFQTALTGELFALLSHQSVLRHSLGNWSDACFLETITACFARPDEIGMRLFEIRAKNLLEGDQCGISRLSATLIGFELAATRAYWQNANVAIIGSGELARLYALALDTQGVRAKLHKASTLTLKGLCALKRGLFNA